jgi:hypothetical protein
METTVKALKYLTAPLAAAAISGAILLAPIADAATSPPVAATTSAAVGNAGTDPLVPYGTDPQVPYRLGYIDSNHDEANTTNGEVDLPF